MRLGRLLRYTGSALPAVVLLAVAPPAHGATTRYVASNGTDSTLCGFPVINGFTCGAKESPCRSISCAIREAAAGDTIIVGPGRYGDVTRDGALDDDGDEFGSSGCDCMLSINKGVRVHSSDGAAATVIDARNVAVNTNVRIIAQNAEFGKPGGGFMVTATGSANGDGLVIDSADVAVRGNQVIGEMEGALNGKVGILVPTAVSGVLIQGNQVVGWNEGIHSNGLGTIIRKNKVALNHSGIDVEESAVVVGNVSVDNSLGIELNDTASAVGNAAIGNHDGLSLNSSFSGGPIEKNNWFGNFGGISNCGLRSFTSSDVLAARNYWGAATGPGPDPADALCENGSGTTTVTPFATVPFKVKATIKP